MNTIIRIEGISKKYTLSHQRKEHYYALRDVMTDAARRWSKKIFYPFSTYRGPRTTYEEFWALRDISFNINEGDRIGIIGRNGAGKSTLLKILSRITEPTSGRVRIRGRVASLLEVGTGFHPELTGRENIYLNGAILGMSKAEIKKKFDEIVDFAEVEKFLDTPVKRYSSGMYVRLAFAVAAHLEPEILIVDEVLAVGDTQFQKKCLGKMESVSTKEGRTVLFVSHNMAAITALCDRAIWLIDGQLESDGDAEQITSKYLLYGTERSGEVLINNDNLVERFYFKRLTMLNSKGDTTSVFDIRQPIKIQLEYHAAHSIKNLELSLRIYNSSGIPIFTTNRSSSYPLGVKEGTSISEIIIPASFLIPGLYTISLGAHITNVEVLAQHNSLASFEIAETGSGMSPYRGLAHGVVIVNIPWQEIISKVK